ncbi:MAG: zf-HC2 domain-containing protein [Chloroflexota bacterium]|nr:zf-HC2 domain-containing protein [Chloroflexota bacterium]
MRCRDAKLWLAAQRDGDLTPSEAAQLQEHLEQCSACRAYGQQLRSMDGLLVAGASPVYASISTERIMQAVRQRQQITQQLEDLRTRQRSRLSRMLVVGPSLAGIILFTIGSIPLLLLAITIVQPDLVVRMLMPLGDVAEVLIVLVQSLQTGLVLVTRDNWLLVGIAFVLVLMMGMWLRLMRYPQEA